MTPAARMDPELEAIRAQRMAQLAAQGGGMPGGMGADPQAAQAAAEAKMAQEEQRTAMLQACMTAGARERLARIALVKPEKARSVEDGVLRMAQRGQISEPVSEDRLVQMLEGNSGGAAGEGRRGPKITIQRRNMLDDDDW